MSELSNDCFSTKKQMNRSGEIKVSILFAHTLMAHNTQIVCPICTVILNRKRPNLVVSVSDYGTRGPGLIPMWAPSIHCFFPFLSTIMLNYFIQVM